MAEQGGPGREESEIVVGVSSCLLGENVRYDGGHKRDRYITETLGRFFRFFPVCPEVGAGLPVPREPMRLQGDAASPRLVTVRTGRDLTEQVRGWSEQKAADLEREDLCGFIFKGKSPTSGLFRVKVYNKGVPARHGRGVFAAAVIQRLPFLPVEEEGRLQDPAIRENFIERIFACRRWKDFRQRNPNYGELLEFHADHKLQLMAHAPRLCRELGALLGHGRDLSFSDVLHRYGESFMQILAMQATAKKNTDVLFHILGYFKKDLTGEEKEEALDLIRQYHDHIVPLIVPITLLNHYVKKYRQEYLARQFYLHPYPPELMLRNYS